VSTPGTPWFVLRVPLPPHGEEFLLVDGLRRVGARAVVREGAHVLAWLAPPAHVNDLLREARAVIRASTSMTEPQLDWQWQTHDEWAARWAADVEPRRVTDRIIVAPAGREVEAGNADIVIRLEAGAAFGTAEHATTRGCLRLLERLVQPGARVVDIGTGTGVLAIAAVRLGARHVLALEADGHACVSAARNIAVNGVASFIQLRVQTVTAADVRAMPRADVVLANLEAPVIHGLLPALRTIIDPGGAAIVAGVTGGEQRALLSAAATAGLTMQENEDSDGWPCTVFRASSPSPHQRQR
jgi:ribosomal protein L11 methyltransferase